MRTFLVLIFTVAILCVLDLLAFQGHHTQATWQEARDHGQQMGHELGYQLKKIGWK